MENNKLVVGNMKMNMTIEDVSNYLKVINKEINNKQVVICPTSIYIPYFLKQNYNVGLQNTFSVSEGAYTGEISPKQASSIGVKYTIIGHSERRIHFSETDTDINKKIHEAIKYNLKVIFCIGETIEEKNLLKTDRVLKRQILNGLRNLENEMFDNVYIAYEPVWAIGTGLVPSQKEISDAINYIKSIVETNFGYKDIKVLYGGSVNEKNIKEINSIPNVNGVLVGGASIDSSKFLKIIEVVVNQ